MTFGQWLTVGLETAVFTLGVAEFLLLGSPETTRGTASVMVFIAIGYCICRCLS
jgi:hypothetical protein